MTYTEAYRDGLTEIDPEALYNCVECKRVYGGRQLNYHMVRRHDYVWVDTFVTGKKS